MADVKDREKVLEKLKEFLTQIYEKIQAQELFDAKITSRTKQNLKFDEQHNVWTLGTRKTVKPITTKGGAKQLLKLANSMAYIIDLLEQKAGSTLREMYYQSLGWGSEHSMFETVNESNLMLENIEILLDELRENLGIIPENSGKIFGNMTVSETTRAGERTLNCSKDVNNAGYLLPMSFNDLKIKSCDFDFVLVIETGGLFLRLIEDQFDSKQRCLLVLTGGQPGRILRTLLKQLADKWQKPIAIFTDGDYWGHQIAKGIQGGFIKSAHLSKMLAIPSAKHIGLHLDQIEEYNLPTDKATKIELARAKESLNDPRYTAEDIRNLNKILELKLKSEQQALAKYGLKFCSEIFLPKVLTQYGFIK